MNDMNNKGYRLDLGDLETTISIRLIYSLSTLALYSEREIADIALNDLAVRRVTYRYGDIWWRSMYHFDRAPATPSTNATTPAACMIVSFVSI